MLVKLANRFQSEISLAKDGMEVSAKSIMGLLTLEGHQGAVITVTAQGDDAEEAVQAMRDLFDRKFDEE